MKTVEHVFLKWNYKIKRCYWFHGSLIVAQENAASNLECQC